MAHAHSHSAGIDIHAHFYPRAFLQMVADEGGALEARCRLPDRAGETGSLTADGTTWPAEHRMVDIDARLAEMDRQGVAVHALSLTAPMVYWAGGELSRKLSAVFNDGCAAAHQKHPSRFVGLAMIPMQEPKLAIAELERAAKLPGIRGVYMATRIVDRELSDPAFLPVFERIVELKLPVFLHPIKVVDPARLKAYYLNNLVGNPTESAMAASHLIYGGVLDRLPGLVVCLPHAGGSFPYLYGRINHGWKVRPECRHLKNPPESYLRRFYYDTITHAEKPLTYLLDLVGPDRVILGSDYCFDMGYEQPVEVVAHHPRLSEADKARVLGGNARRLLGL